RAAAALRQREVPRQGAAEGATADRQGGGRGAAVGDRARTGERAHAHRLAVDVHGPGRDGERADLIGGYRIEQRERAGAAVGNALITGREVRRLGAGRSEVVGIAGGDLDGPAAKVEIAADVPEAGLAEEAAGSIAGVIDVIGVDRADV